MITLDHRRQLSPRSHLLRSFIAALAHTSPIVSTFHFATARRLSRLRRLCISASPPTLSRHQQMITAFDVQPAV